jgi:hypothetical protein
MGFSTLLDILGATLIGGFLLLILLRMNGASAENTYRNNYELIVQQNLVEVVKLIEYDFRKIGYCLEPDSLANSALYIIEADSNRIKFRTDVAEPPTYPHGDGNVDVLEYYLGTEDIPSTENPEDRLLYRVLNNETPKGSNLGVTSFHLTYFNDLGSLLSTPVVNPGAIGVIQIDIEIQNTEAVTSQFNDPGKSKYSSIFWRQIRMVSRNLDNR